MLNPTTFVFLPFVLLWLFFAFAGGFGPILSPLLFIVPIVFIILVVMAPGLLGGLLYASRTRYVLTDRRIVIDAPRRRTEIDLATLPFVELERSLFGTATIYLAPRSPYDTWTRPSATLSAPALRAIADGDHVYELITQAREQARAR